MVTVCSLVLSACSVGQKLADKVDQKENKIENKLSSLKDLLSLGKEQKCTWSSDESGTKSSGEMRIKGTKFRQSVTMQVGDKPETNMEMVNDGEWTYLWNPKTKEQGMKIKMTEDQKTESQKLANGSLDWGKQYNYNCSATTVSDDEMTPPSDVKFMDLNALQDQFKNLVPSGIEN